MSNIKLYQAEECARQIEIISLMLESYPHKMADREITAVASLTHKLSRSIAAYLNEELIRNGD